MGKELANQEVNLDHLPKNKQLYLYYRIYGLNPNESMRLVGIKPSMLPQWRVHDKGFKSIEEYVLGNGEELIEKSGGVIDKVIEVGILRQALRVNELTDKILSKEDMALIKWAVDTWFKRRGKDASSPDSYDELILKKHRKVK